MTLALEAPRPGRELVASRQGPWRAVLAVAKKAALVPLRALVKQPSTGPKLEAVALYLARTHPRLRFTRWYVFHLGRFLVDVSWRPPFRTAFLPERFRLRLSIQENYARHVYFFGTFEPDTATLFRRFVRPGSVVFDIGANLGYYTLLAGALVGRSGQVHAFEPDRDVRALLQESVALNKFEDRIRVDGRAVYKEDDQELRLYTSDSFANKGLSSLIQEHSWGKFDHAVEVSTVTIDRYVQQRSIHQIDVLKMDIEGAEITALQGMQRTLREHPPTAIILEARYDGLASPQELLDFLRGFGYHSYLVQRGGPQAIATLMLGFNEDVNLLFLQQPVRASFRAGTW